MIALSANFNQLDKISRGLSAKIMFADSRKRILDDDFSQRVQARSSTGDDRDLRLEKEIELTGERRFGPPRPFCHSLNAAQRFRAPGNDQAGVAKLSFTKKNRGRALHGGI